MFQCFYYFLYIIFGIGSRLISIHIRRYFPITLSPTGNFKIVDKNNRLRKLLTFQMASIETYFLKCLPSNISKMAPSMGRRLSIKDSSPLAKVNLADVIDNKLAEPLSYESFRQYMMNRVYIN